MKKLIILLPLLLAGCTDANTAQRALDNHGFDNIVITGYRFFNSCGEGYTYQTGFEATNSKGKKVTGVVCSGWFSSATVKFD